MGTFLYNYPPESCYPEEILKISIFPHKSTRFVEQKIAKVAKFPTFASFATLSEAGVQNLSLFRVRLSTTRPRRAGLWPFNWLSRIELWFLCGYRRS